MNNVNKTLYIPLYAKAYVTKRSLFICDRMAEEIWERESFPLRGKSRSKWLAYYLGIRAAVYDGWIKERLQDEPSSAVIHIGCGLDGRVKRTDHAGAMWYDVDFPQVIEERRRYYTEGDGYAMIGADVRSDGWCDNISADSAIVIMEGVSMYMSEEELGGLFSILEKKFSRVSLLMDAYSSLAARLSKRRNPVSEVGVSEVWGLDEPKSVERGGLKFLREREMTPERYINELSGLERAIFKRLYAGDFSKKLYRMYEYKKGGCL